VLQLPAVLFFQMFTRRAAAGVCADPIRGMVARYDEYGSM
jgi:hypothetical protein